MNLYILILSISNGLTLIPLLVFEMDVPDCGRSDRPRSYRAFIFSALPGMFELELVIPLLLLVGPTGCDVELGPPELPVVTLDAELGLEFRLSRPDLSILKFEKVNS